MRVVNLYKEINVYIKKKKAVSGEPELTDGRANDGRLCHDSSSADKVQRS